ncbi:MAG: isoprenylcysteine carboxylmethyltransferase family protein [Deltaproteobacteria bacterium]|nr:isoprenylcysteine carboxylmethyltransferase family protein [Deltaproteobacteria bacterium]
MRRSRAVIASYGGVVVFAAVIFIAAGRLDFGPGLLYLALALVGTTLTHLLEPRGSGVLEARIEDVRGGEAWDRNLLRLSALVTFAMFAVGGLDAGRFGWSGPFPTALTVAGVALMVVGQGLYAVARRQNAYFSSVVRIQAERGHAVCDTGLYGVVRHPGYLGMLGLILAFPLVVQSYWAFAPATASTGLLIVRTVREDRFLHANLPGYAAYAGRTRWRLVPGIF